MAASYHSTPRRSAHPHSRALEDVLGSRTLWLFAGVILTGGAAVALLTSAATGLLVPANNIGLRPYLVSSLPAVLKLVAAVLLAAWCVWLWRQIFAADAPRREVPQPRRVAPQTTRARPIERPVAPPRHALATPVPAGAPAPGASPRTSLDALEVPARVRHTLEVAGMRSVEDVTARTGAQLLEIRGFGARSLAEVESALDGAGRALRYPDPPWAF